MPLYTTEFSSPLGTLRAIATDMSLIMLEFGDSKNLEQKIDTVEYMYKEKCTSEMNTLLAQTKIQLSEYFEGKRTTFSLLLSPEGTEFQKKAWQALEKIPYAETRSYKEEAILAGNPKAVRAIGGANNKNPIVIIIPCHRVIGSSGELVGYGGGIERKKWLLEHEATSNLSLKQEGQSL